MKIKKNASNSIDLVNSCTLVIYGGGVKSDHHGVAMNWLSKLFFNSKNQLASTKLGRHNSYIANPSQKANMNKPFVSLKTAAEGKVEGIKKETNFQVDPALVKVKPGFNRPIDRANVEQFKTSIKAGATIPPIYVTVTDGVIELVDGEHRWIAVCELVAEGEPILSMAAIQFRGDAAEQIAHLLTSSQGKPLTPLESGLQYQKLARYGWTTKQIADRVGRSQGHVSQCIALAESGIEVKQAVQRGEVSSTLAMEVVRTHGAGAGAVIKEKVEQAKAEGKKRVTAASGKPSKPTRKALEELAEASMNWSDGIGNANTLSDAVLKFRNSF